MKIVDPVKTREPFFDGWETEKVKHRFACASCGARECINFKPILDAAWGWKERTESPIKIKLAELFSIDLKNKYIGNGMDAVVTTKCSHCEEITYTYFWFNEYRHSCYQITYLGSAYSGN